MWSFIGIIKDTLKCEYEYNTQECKYQNGACADFNNKYPRCEMVGSSGYGGDGPGGKFDYAGYISSVLWTAVGSHKLLSSLR